MGKCSRPCCIFHTLKSFIRIAGKYFHLEYHAICAFVKQYFCGIINILRTSYN